MQAKDINILSIRFGSQLYGTATPHSDIDLKSVHIPSARDILLGRAKGSIGIKRPKLEGEKNYAGEIDEESYSLQRYLNLLAEGQTVAVDVLFAPDWAAIKPPSPIWHEIFKNRHRLLSRKSAAFIGYCRQQANKYGIKGSRVAAARAALTLLDAGMQTYGVTAKLRELATVIVELTSTHEHMALIDLAMPNGTLIKHWEVIGRKLPFTTSIKSAHDIMLKIVTEYGHRALKAEAQEGIDWKALSHAVRVGRQAIELFHTGEIIFPRPEAAHLVAIKTGQLAYQKVAEEIEQLFEHMENAAMISDLPDSADQEWIDDFVYETYKGTIK